MATPTRSQMVSTPKNPISTTPNRPNTSIANKHLAGKSPAVKTPASIHGHAHRISTSSHPTSTPLAASILPDDILNLNTPSAAALMATMGTIGLTPLPTTQDGLGITTSIQGGSTQDGGGAKNLPLDRYIRLKEIATTLKQKAAGRGVTMESIKQVAQINGFDADWDNDENILTLAGKKSVEVEIAFDKDDISLVDRTIFKLNLPGEEEAILQEEDSSVLQSNLKDNEHANLPWRDLTDFSANLEYLGQLEHVETPGNCFGIIDNLYDTFQKIWTEEKKRMKWRHDVHHLCQSNVGEPRRNANKRLGVSSRYWVDGQRFFRKQEPKIKDKGRTGTGWTAKFTIETGQPSISASQKWVADEPLASTVTAEDIFHDSTTDKPVWLDPDPSQNKAPGDDPMKLDEPTSQLNESLNIHFVCQLEPEVMVPLNVAQSLNQTSRMFDMHEQDLRTYYHLMDGNADRKAQTIDRWSRSQHTFDRQGKPRESIHSYALYANNGGWVYPVKRLSISHPRQFADAIPILRQYALVSSLFTSIAVENSTISTEHAPELPGTGEQRVLPDRSKITKRTNKPKLDDRLSSILRPNAAIRLSDMTPLAIDIRLDPLHSPENKSCRIDVRIPLSLNVLPRAVLTNLNAKAFLIFTVDVLRNGIIEVPNVQGVDLRDKSEELKRRLARVVRASENLGVVVDWLLRELEDV